MRNFILYFTGSSSAPECLETPGVTGPCEARFTKYTYYPVIYQTKYVYL
jgi:hypothetical protein